MAFVHVTAPVLTEKQIRRFWAKVRRRGPDACWPCRKPTANGYGRFGVNFGKGVYREFGTHVIARYLATGEWPGGLNTCHSCDNPSCCNPAHLFLGTHKDNAADMIRKGRHHNGVRPRGSQQWRAAFDEAQVVAIRVEYAGGEVTLQQLADRHHVTKHCIHCIVTRKTWKHLS